MSDKYLKYNQSMISIAMSSLHAQIEIAQHQIALITYDFQTKALVIQAPGT